MKKLNKKVKYYHNDDWDIFHDFLFEQFNHIETSDTSDTVVIDRSEIGIVEGIMEVLENDASQKKYYEILKQVKQDFDNGIDVVIIETF